MIRLRLALPIAATVILIAMGCGGSFIGGNTSSQLQGTWTLDSMTVAGNTQTCPATATPTTATGNMTASITCARFTDQFNSDGTMTRKTPDGVTSTNGNFNYNGTVLTIAFGNEDHQMPVSFTNGNGTFSTTQNIFGYSVVYTFIRQQ